MHDMITKMQEAYEQATQHMHAEMSRLAGGVLSEEQLAQRQGLLDPLAEMEAEVARIRAALSHEMVRPDIDGWGQQKATPVSTIAAGSQPRTPARTPAGSASLGPAVVGSSAQTPAGSPTFGSTWLGS